MNELAPVYRDVAATGGLNYRSERAEFIDWVVAQLRRRPGRIEDLRFLDFGCGTGELLELLHGAGARRLVGMDLAEKMLAETVHNVPAACGVRAAVEQHPFAGGGFDVIVAAFAVHHVADPGSFFAMARQVLRPGGELFLLDYNRTGWALEGWKSGLIRVATSPARFAARLKNRARRARVARVPLAFSPVHRIRTFAEFEAAARACDLRLSAVTGGMLSMWFNRDLFDESELDRRLLRALRACDRRLVPEGAGGFLWIRGAVSAVGGPAPAEPAPGSASDTESP